MQWLEDKTAHLEGFAKTQAQQELYRKLLPQVQGKQFQEQRQELKNQVYYKAQQSQNPVFVKKTEVDLRKEDLADFAKQKHGLKPQLNTKQVFDGIVKEAQARNINMQSLNNYLNNGDETFLYEMGFKQAPTRQGGIKGIASSIAGDWGWGERINPIGKITETIDDLVQKIPTLSEEEWDQFAREKLG